MTEKGTRWDTIRRRLADSWHYLRDSISTQWDKLSEDDLKEVEGRIEKLADKIQERYGVARDEAMRQIDAWADREIPYMGTVRQSASTRWAVALFVMAVFMGVIAYSGLTELIEALAGLLFWLFLAGAVILTVWRLTKGRG